MTSIISSISLSGGGVSVNVNGQPYIMGSNGKLRPLCVRCKKGITDQMYGVGDIIVVLNVMNTRMAVLYVMDP